MRGLIAHLVAVRTAYLAPRRLPQIEESCTFHEPGPASDSPTRLLARNKRPIWRKRNLTLDLHGREGVSLALTFSHYLLEMFWVPGQWEHCSGKCGGECVRRRERQRAQWVGLTACGRGRGREKERVRETDDNCDRGSVGCLLTMYCIMASYDATLHGPPRNKCDWSFSPGWKKRYFDHPAGGLEGCLNSWLRDPSVNGLGVAYSCPCHIQHLSPIPSLHSYINSHFFI